MGSNPEPLHQALGIHSMWGTTPCKNLSSLILDNNKNDEPINMLLLSSSGDPCHIFKTISEEGLLVQNHSNDENQNRPVVHFYIVENTNNECSSSSSCMEILARHLLLLYIFLDKTVPIRHRASILLEIYGNTMLSESTVDYLVKVTTDLFKLIEILDSDYDNCIIGEESDALEIMSDIIDLSFLKCKERDQLQTIFKSWSKTQAQTRQSSLPDNHYNLSEYRDYRMRHFYGERYDFRKNIIDWDYQNYVKPIASIIHPKLFQKWRMDGIAYEFGDCQYKIPNITCATHTKGRDKAKGCVKDVLGYWLDILISPYISFGVQVDNTRTTKKDFSSELLQVLNKGTGAEQQRHHCVEVAMYNLMSFMWRIQTGKNYEMKKAHDIFSGLGSEKTNETDCNDEKKLQGENCSSSSQQQQRQQRKNKSRRVKITLIPNGINTILHRKRSKFLHKFDLLFVSQRFLLFDQPSNKDFSFSSDTFLNILRPRARICIETPKYLFPLSKQQKEMIVDQIFAIENEQKWKQVHVVNVSTDKKEGNMKKKKEQYYLKDDFVVLQRGD